MKLLEDRIIKDGIVKDGGVLKVDSFLNHQMDIELFNEIGKEFKRLFSEESKRINKILTIEASGIGIACIVAQHFGVPVVFAKKAQSINIDGEVYSTKIQSFTHGKVYDVIVSKKYISNEDHILIIADFPAAEMQLVWFHIPFPSNAADACSFCILYHSDEPDPPCSAADSLKL